MSSDSRLDRQDSAVSAQNPGVSADGGQATIMAAVNRMQSLLSGVARSADSKSDSAPPSPVVGLRKSVSGVNRSKTTCTSHSACIGGAM